MPQWPMWLVTASFFAGFVPGTLAGASVETLYRFNGTPDGSSPDSPLIAGSGGVFFGTTYSGGAYGEGSVFSLTPPTPAGEPWREAIIYSFQGGTDGEHPIAGLSIGPGSVLYGITESGGNGNGSVFSLSPPAASGEDWIETVLYSFPAIQYGDFPVSRVLLGPGGSLFGITRALEAGQYGNFYELAPPLSSGQLWRYSALYTFTQTDISFATLTSGPKGSIYLLGQTGGTLGNGGVGQLLPPSSTESKWTEKTIFSLPAYDVPAGNLVVSPNGELYGTTLFGGPSHVGLVFELTPSIGTESDWTETTIFLFTASNGSEPNSLLLTPAGNLVGTTIYGGTNSKGTVFALVPGAAGGQWTEASLYSFPPQVGSFSPNGPLIFGPGNYLYGTTYSGGPAGLGTAYLISLN